MLCVKIYMGVYYKYLTCLLNMIHTMYDNVCVTSYIYIN